MKYLKYRKKEKNRIFYLVELSFKSKRLSQSNKKVRKFNMRKPAVRKMLREVLQAKENYTGQKTGST